MAGNTNLKSDRLTSPLSHMLTDVSIREGGQQDVDLRHAGIDTKLDFMSLAVGSGVKQIELTGFAPGPWFSDAEALVRGAADRLPDAVSLRVRYFNTEGLADLMKHPRIMREGLFLTAATAKYREKNYGQKSIEHAEVKMKRLITAFKKHGLRFDTLVMSTAWGACDEMSMQESTLDYLKTTRQKIPICWRDLKFFNNMDYFFNRRYRVVVDNDPLAAPTQRTRSPKVKPIGPQT